VFYLGVFLGGFLVATILGNGHEPEPPRTVNVMEVHQ